MAKCIACGKFIAAKGSASCNTCHNKYHLACAQLKESPKPNCIWQCSDCKQKALLSNTTITAADKLCDSRSGSTASSSGSTIASFEDAAEQAVYQRDETRLIAGTGLGQEMRIIREEIQEIKGELKKGLKEIRREVAELRHTVSLCSKRLDGLESRIEALENKRIGDTSEDLQDKFEQTVQHLKMELNDREQDLLSSDLEISNLPEDKGENIIHTVELVAVKLGINIKPEDIVFAERVGPKPSRVPDQDESGRTSGAGGRGGARGRRIVVRLARRGLRDELLHAARVRRGTTSADLGFAAPPHRFYLNERLTRANKHLFYLVRQAAERLGWRYTWTKRGKILTRQADGKRTYNIRSEDDLERVFW